MGLTSAGSADHRQIISVTSKTGIFVILKSWADEISENSKVEIFGPQTFAVTLTRDQILMDP